MFVVKEIGKNTPHKNIPEKINQNGDNCEGFV